MYSKVRNASPKTNQILLHGFSSATLKASCASHSNVSIELNQINKIIYKWNSRLTNGEFFAEAELRKLPVESKGTLICFQTINFAGLSQNNILHFWTYSVKGM